MGQLDVNSSVADWVLQRPDRSRLFSRLGIDYCCGGHKSLAEACAENGLDGETVVQTLEAAEAMNVAAGAEERDWREASLAELCDHIEQTHHQYVREQLPRVHGLLDKVIGAHGENHPELWEVKEHFTNLGHELFSHLQKEEGVLFPAIRMLEAGQVTPAALPFRTVANPIRMMVAEHDAAGEELGAIRRLTHDYQPPADACGSYRAMLDALKGWEEDLHEHIHKENNILFPRAVAFEESHR